MPRLRKHKAKEGHYILTRIGNQIVTYQLAKEGWERLQAAGIDVDQRFGRALLLDLYATVKFSRMAPVPDRSSSMPMSASSNSISEMAPNPKPISPAAANAARLMTFIS